MKETETYFEDLLTDEQCDAAIGDSLDIVIPEMATCIVKSLGAQGGIPMSSIDAVRDGVLRYLEYEFTVGITGEEGNNLLEAIRIAVKKDRNGVKRAA